MSRQMNSTAKRLKIIPMVRVMAKPLIGPVPNIKSTSAVIRVVTCESIILEKALEKPVSTPALMDLPKVNSSRIRS